MAEELTNVPEHVAIIMDGNGRWAKNRGLARVKGHEVGAESVRAIVKACKKFGIKYLTLYAFSVENWIRPPHEIAALMNLLRTFLKDNEHELHENKIRLRICGRLQDFPKIVQNELNRVMAATEHYDQGQFILGLSYSSRTELVASVKAIAEKVKNGELALSDIKEETIAQHLYLPDVPDPDLMIRTSGELRISNFLLWQISYAELYFTETMWPDFREPQFKAALEDYGRRNRRFGDIE